MPKFIAYIDEAGDEGFGKLKEGGKPGGQSQWLAIGGCIVLVEQDGKLPALRSKILGRFPNRAPKDLHFRFLNHDQKVAACQEIGAFPLAAAVMLSH